MHLQSGRIHGRSVQAVLLKDGYNIEVEAISTPQQIGVSDCVDQTLCSMVRCLLVDSGLPPKIWGEFMLTAAYLSATA